MKKKFIFLTILIILVIVGVIAFYILSQPSKEKLTKEFKEEAIANLLGRKAQLDDTTPKGYKKFEGKYITFNYPAKALVYTYRGSTPSAILEDFSFDIKKPKMVFNLQVFSRPDFSTVGDFPAVNLRRQRSYEYKESPFEISGKKGVLFTKNENGGERSGFVLNDKILYSIVVTGEDQDEVISLFDSIVSSASF